ncbi:hypothetical protein TNCV_629431 [Trichonephila clavipes]|nr:hypothetical protein TNCV_629431 [Trichonephila clavipes]
MNVWDVYPLPIIGKRPCMVVMSRQIFDRWCCMLRQGTQTVECEYLNGHPSTFMNEYNNAPLDFHLLSAMKAVLLESYFQNNGEVEQVMRKCLASQGTRFYHSGFSQLITCCNKCLNDGGHYIET